MIKLVILIPVIVLFAGCFNYSNPVTTTNFLYVNDTLAVGIVGEHYPWAANSFSLDTADLYGYGYQNGIILTGANGPDTIRLQIPFVWTDSVEAYHQLDTGWFAFGLSHPRPLVAPFTELLCTLSMDTTNGGASYNFFQSEDTSGHYQGSLNITNLDSNYIAGSFNVNVLSTGSAPTLMIPLNLGYFVFSYRKTVQP